MFEKLFALIGSEALVGLKDGDSKSLFGFVLVFMQSRSDKVFSDICSVDAVPETSHGCPKAKSHEEQSSSFFSEDDCLDAIFDDHFRHESNRIDDSRTTKPSVSSQESFEGAPSRPEAAAAVDAGSVLEMALATGDTSLAAAAVNAGMQSCSILWVANAYGELQASGISLRDDTIAELIRFYGSEKRADLAVDAWEARCMELGEDPTEVATVHPSSCDELYGLVLEACARAGDFDSASRAAMSTGWQAPPCKHGQSAFLALARWYARRQDLQQAEECYQAVRNITHHADLTTHRAILVASVRSSDMGRADALFQDLLASGVAPDGATFCALIRGHCSAGNFDEAMHYFKMLRTSGIVPTASLFDAILDGCVSMNMPGLMEQVLADMEATGTQPSTATLSLLMKRHGMNREPDHAIALFDDMPRRHGLKLDGNAYGTLISVCLKNDVYDIAWKAFERMSAFGLMADARIYDALIAASARRGLLDNAIQVVDEALGTFKQKEKPDSQLPRLHLQPRTLENLLHLIGRRRHCRTLGAPMVRRLRLAGIELSENVVDAIINSVEIEADLPRSQLQSRREDRHNWRSLSKAHGSWCDGHSNFNSPVR